MKKVLLTLSLAFVPAVASAQQALGNINNLVVSAGNILRSVIPILFVLALIVFFWGLIRFLTKADDEEAKANGRRLMVWGIIALFVMASVWGLVSFLGDAVGIDQGQDIPAVPGVSPRAGAR